MDYGAFVEIAPGVEGLLHVSQLARTSVEKVTDVVREGETHLLRIVSLDANKQRIGLSLKAVTSKEQIEWMSSRSDLGESTTQAVDTPTPAPVVEDEPEPTSTDESNGDNDAEETSE